MKPLPRARLAGLLALGTLSLAGCRGAESSASGEGLARLPPPPVTISQPVVRDVTDYDEYEGRLEAVNTVDLRAQVRGYLVAVHFNDGDLVKKGAVLFEIDDRPYKATLDAAKAQVAASQASVKLAQTEFARFSALAAKGVASKEEAETWTAKAATALADSQKAAAAVEQAELDLGFTKITAPIDGRIGRRLVDVGNLVTSSSELSTLVSIQPMHVYFDVDERAVLRFRESRIKNLPAGAPVPPFADLKIPVEVGLDGETGYPHTGLLDFADNRVNKSTGTLLVRGVLDNSSRILSDGLRARVRIPAGSPHKVTLVTERAIGSEQGRKFVWVVNPDNIVMQRDVTTERNYDRLQAVRGLQEDEWIVVNGIQRVRDGMTVEPSKVPMPDAEPAPTGSR